MKNRKLNHLWTINLPSGMFKRSIAVLFLVVAASTLGAQNVTLKQKNASLESILNEIKNQTNLSFVVNRNEVDLNQKLSIDATNEEIDKLLGRLLKSTNLTYKIDGKHITITPKSKTTVKKIQGSITDESGETVIGANIKIKGEATGTISDMEGKFSLDVPMGATLEISYVGYASQDIAVNNANPLKIRLTPNNQELSELVVTALGIKRKESSLTYSVQQVNGDELTRSKDPNMINALAGKTSGVQISRSSAGLGGSAKVEIRGARSISGNNQPLYVIDGVPMINSTSEQAFSVMGGTSDGANRDSGDGISNLNPDDIESINILKGASAAALYGSQAANGVILISTKKGKAGVQRVQFSSNVTWDQVNLLPELQNNYGSADGIKSWGASGINAYDNLKDFFSTGVTAINSVSVQTGNEKAQTHISYANTTAKGIIDNNKLSKHNINVRGTTTLFNDLLTVDANINILRQDIKNRPTSGGLYMNPLVGLYTFARGVDMTPYREGFETYNPVRNFKTQNWNSITEFNQNPYWLKNRSLSNDTRTRVITGITASIKATDWLTIQGRVNYDEINDKYDQQIYASTHEAISSANGRFVSMTHSESLFYGDILALFKKNWGQWSFNGAVGGSINDSKVNTLRLDSKTAPLYYPNVFTVSNINMTSAGYIEELINGRKQIQSLFGTAQIGFKESLYLDLTARNDWSSSLAYTKSAAKGYFYPSVGLSWIINEMIELPQWIDFGKVRGSWTMVSNDIPIFISKSEDHIGAGGQVIANNTAPFDDLKPERSKSLEFGTEWKFFGNRLDMEVTYYKTNTTNQLFTLPSTAGAKYANYYVNAGNIENQGIEATLGIIPVQSESFRWKTNFNYSMNRSEVIELHNQLPTFVYPGSSTSISYGMQVGS